MIAHPEHFLLQIEMCGCHWDANLGHDTVELRKHPLHEVHRLRHWNGQTLWIQLHALHQTGVKVWVHGGVHTTVHRPVKAGRVITHPSI